MEIEKNMIRDRAESLPEVTDERWLPVSQHNKEMLKEFLDANKHLSPKSIKQYTSALRIFFAYVCENLNNKPLYQIKKRDFIKYFAFLQEHNLSSSALKLKKSAVSSLCNYIENVVAEEEDDYKGFRNPTKAIKDIPANKVYEKVPITKEEYDKIVEFLLGKEDYLGLAWFTMAFNTGARKAELIQYKSSMLDVDESKNNTFYETNLVRAKGRGHSGKAYKHLFNKDALKYAKLWIEKRGYDHEYLFTVKYCGEIKPISISWANDFCGIVLTKFLGRRVNPHILRASAATYLMNLGVDINKISKLILHHESIEVSQRYLIRDETEDKNSIFSI